MASSTANEECYYKILGVGRLASEREIRKAYKCLALHFHPDKQTSDQDRQDATRVFVKINNAHELLTDPEQRKKYDEKLHASSYQRTSKNSTKEQASSEPSSDCRWAGSSSKHNHSHHDARSSHSNASSGNHYGRRQSYHKASSSKPKQQSSTSGAWNSYGGHQNGSTWNSYSFNSDNQNYYNGSSHQWNAHYRTKRHYSSSQHGASYSYTKQQQQESSSYGGTPKARSSSHRQKSSTSGPSAKQQRTQSNHSPPKRSTVFGTCETTGEPCLRCMKKGGYCHQHKDQDPTDSNYRPKADPPKPNCPVYGRNRNGDPCRRCMRMGGFCHQHVDQQHASGSNSSSKKRGASLRGSHTTSRVYGVRSDGEPCLRCQKQGRYCHQHVYQEV